MNQGKHIKRSEEMNGQISLFEIAPDIVPNRINYKMTADHKPGDYLEDFGERRGANICHIMRPGYIGKLVCFDCSTQSHQWTRVGILEDYIPYENTYRSIIYVGKSQRILLTHRPGIEIYEVGHREWINGKWELR